MGKTLYSQPSSTFSVSSQATMRISIVSKSTASLKTKDDGYDIGAEGGSERSSKQSTLKAESSTPTAYPDTYDSASSNRNKTEYTEAAKLPVHLHPALKHTLQRLAKPSMPKPSGRNV